MRGERGFVLASTLSILLLLSTIALAVAFMGRLELKAASRRTEARQAYLAARSGLTFMEQKLSELDSTYFALDLLSGEDTWESSQLPPLPFAFTVKLTDEAGKLDLNQATGEMLQSLGFTQDEAERIIARREEHPYATVWELGEALALPQDDWGRVEELAAFLTTTSRDPNLNPRGQAKLELGEFTAQELIQASRGVISQSVTAKLVPQGEQITQLEELARILSKEELAEVVDWVAAGRSSKININTAPEEVLAAIPGFSEELVASILQRREEAPLQQLSDLVLLEEFSLASWQQCARWVTVSSTLFCLQAEGRYREAKSSLVVIWDGERYLSWQEE